MKVITEAIPIIKLAPRFYPDDYNGVELIFQNGLEIDFTIEKQKNLLVITLDNTTGFEQREVSEFTLMQLGEIIFKGRVIFLKDNTDVQNYTNQSQDNTPWKE